MGILFGGGPERPAWAWLALTGAVSGASRVAPLGVNEDVDTGTFEDVHVASSAGVIGSDDHRLIQWPTTPVAMELVSSSASDSAAGAGARLVAVSYLDSAYAAKSTVISMNGTTPVQMPENVFRVNRLLVASSGTYSGSNIGDIDIRASGGTRIYQRIRAGFGLGQTSQFSVPAGMSCDILGMLFTTDEIDTQRRASRYSICVQDQLTGSMFKGLQLGISSSTPYLHHGSGVVPLTTIPSQTDVWFRVESVSQNNTYCTAGYLAIVR